MNEGSRPADWRLAVDGGVPLSVAPAAGRLPPGGAVELAAALAAGDAGTLSGELLLFVAPPPPQAGDDGQQKAEGAGGGGEAPPGGLPQEPVPRCPIGASVVACSYELRAPERAAR